MIETEPRVGLPCVVRYTDDNQFYRSEILELNESTAKVLFVDYGNTQETPLGELKQMTPKFMHLPMMVIPAFFYVFLFSSLLHVFFFSVGVEMPPERCHTFKETCRTRNRD